MLGVKKGLRDCRPVDVDRWELPDDCEDLDGLRLGGGLPLVWPRVCLGCIASSWLRYDSRESKGIGFVKYADENRVQREKKEREGGTQGGR